MSKESRVEKGQSGWQEPQNAESGILEVSNAWDFTLYVKGSHERVKGEK